MLSRFLPGISRCAAASDGNAPLSSIPLSLTLFLSLSLKYMYAIVPDDLVNTERKGKAHSGAHVSQP